MAACGADRPCEIDDVGRSTEGPVSRRAPQHSPSRTRRRHGQRRGARANLTRDDVLRGACRPVPCAGRTVGVQQDSGEARRPAGQAASANSVAAVGEDRPERCKCRVRASPAPANSHHLLKKLGPWRAGGGTDGTSAIATEVGVPPTNTEAESAFVAVSITETEEVKPSAHADVPSGVIASAPLPKTLTEAVTRLAVVSITSTVYPSVVMYAKRPSGRIAIASGEVSPMFATTAPAVTSTTITPLKTGH